MNEELLPDAFVELADTMVADFDVIEFLHLLTRRSVQLLDAAAAGVMLADPRGELRLVAASTEAVRVLELFQPRPGALSDEDIRVGPALADVATIGLLQERSARRGDILHEQLQAALNSRVAIEQAKGKLAERLGLDMNQAFSVLRAYARNRNLRLSDFAQAFVDGSPGEFADLIGPPRR